MEEEEPADSAAPAVDRSVPDGGAKKPHQKRNSLAVSGRGHLSLHNFTMNDKQGREVVRPKKGEWLMEVGRIEVKDAIVEARKEPVHLEGDSAGIGGALVRLGINIAAHIKKDKMSYSHEAVHIDGGPGCN